MELIRMVMEAQFMFLMLLVAIIAILPFSILLYMVIVAQSMKFICRAISAQAAVIMNIVFHIQFLLG